MEKVISKKLNITASEDIAGLLELSLKNLNYDANEIIHYTFLIEEALLKWKNEFPADAELIFARENSRKDVVFRFEINGKKCNPFDLDSKEDVTINKMLDRLLSGVGRELKYKFVKDKSGKDECGKNIIKLKLPIKNHEEVLYKKMLLAIMIPLALQGLVENLATCIDTIMLSFVDSKLMSAVSLASQFNTIHILLITAITIAETMLIAQYWGKHERKSVKDTLKIATGLGALVSMIFFIVTFFFPKQIISFYTNEPELINQGAIYLRYISFSYLVIPFVRMYYSFMRVAGSVALVSVFAVVGCIINAILNAVFLFGAFGIEPMGVQGAALATVISALVQLVLVFIHNKKNKFSVLVSSYESNIKETRKLLLSKVCPILTQYAVYLVGINTVSAAIGRMGTDIISANAIISTLATIFVSVKDAVGNGAGILIGAKLGRGEMDKAWRYSRITYIYVVRIAIVIILALDACVLLLRFTSIDLTEGAWSYLLLLMIVISFKTFFEFMNAVSNNGCLFAGGDITTVLIIDALVTAIIMVPLSLIGIFTNWIPTTLLLILLYQDELISCPFKYRQVQKKKWLKNIVN